MAGEAFFHPQTSSDGPTQDALTANNDLFVSLQTTYGDTGSDGITNGQASFQQGKAFKLVIDDMILNGPPDDESVPEQLFVQATIVAKPADAVIVTNAFLALGNVIASQVGTGPDASRIMTELKTLKLVCDRLNNTNDILDDSVDDTPIQPSDLRPRPIPLPNPHQVERFTRLSIAFDALRQVVLDHVNAFGMRNYVLNSLEPLLRRCERIAIANGA